MSTTVSREQPGAPALFTRKATGLVREGRTRDALFYNVMWSSVALTFAFFWILYPLAYQGSNAILAFLIAAALGLPGAFLYAMLAQVMPRTGGDYVFNSRALHPAIGFAANVSYCFWLAVVYGVYTTYIAAYGIGAFSRMMAGYTGSSGWLSFGDWFSTEWGLFITGSAAVLVSALMFILGGTRLFFRVQVGAFALYMLDAFLGGLIVIGFTAGLLIWLPQTMLLISRSMFAWSFDRIMPERLSYVDPRSRSPIVAIGVVTALAIGSTAIYAFTTWFSTLSVLLGLSLTLLVTALAGAVLPYRQRAMVEASPYARTVVGLPLFTVV